MVLKKLSKYPLDVDVRDKKTGKTVVELCQTKGRKHLMPLLVEAVQTWNEFRDAVQLGLDKPEVCNSMIFSTSIGSGIFIFKFQLMLMIPNKYVYHHF